MKTLATLILCALAVAALAGPVKVYEVAVTTVTNAGATATGTIRPKAGVIDSVAIDMVTAGSTSDVQVAIYDPDSNIPTETILSVTNVTSDSVYRLVTAAKTSTGADSTISEAKYLVAPNMGLRLTLTNATVVSRVYRMFVTMELADE
jgi:hypothetical protein